jgi:fructosamine-3-kinase
MLLLVSLASAALGVSLRDPVVSELSRLGYGRVRRVTQLNSGGSERGLRTSHRRYDTDEGPVFCKTSALACAAEAFEAEAASLRALRSATLGSGLMRMPRPISTGAMPLGGDSAAGFARAHSPAAGRSSHPSTPGQMQLSARTNRLRSTRPTPATTHPLVPGAFLALEWLDLLPLSASFPSTLHAAGEAIADLHIAPQPPGASDAPWAARSPSFGFGRPTYLGAYPQPNGWERSFSDFFVLRRLLPQLEAACAIGGGRR